MMMGFSPVTKSLFGQAPSPAFLVDASSAEYAPMWRTPGRTSDSAGVQRGAPRPDHVRRPRRRLTCGST